MIQAFEDCIQELGSSDSIILHQNHHFILFPTLKVHLKVRTKPGRPSTSPYLTLIAVRRIAFHNLNSEILNFITYPTPPERRCFRFLTSSEVAVGRLASIPQSPHPLADKTPRFLCIVQALIWPSLGCVHSR